MLRPRNLALAIVAIAFLAVLFRLVQQYDPARRNAQEAGAGSVRLVIEDAQMSGTRAGKPDWRLRANRIVMRSDPSGDVEAFRQVEMTGIRDGELFERNVKQASFRADHAVYDQSARRFTIGGAIRLDSPKGDRVESEECVWSERDDFVRFPSGARGAYQGDTLSAPSLLYSPRHRLLICPIGAEGTFQKHPVRAAGITWDLERGLVQCEGPVSGSRKGMDYQASHAELDLKTRTMHMNKGVLHLRIEAESEGPEAFQ